MSGPKVVRIVTREEIEAVCRRHIATVAFAAEELKRRAGRCGMLDEKLEKAISSRLSSFEAMFAAGHWMNIQKGAPDAASFLLAEAERLETSATALAVQARERGRRAADAARSLVGALRAASVPIPVGLEAAAKGKAGSPEEAEKSVTAAFTLIPVAQHQPADTAARAELAARLGGGEEGRTLADLVASRSPEPTATERRLDALIAELGFLDGAAGFATRADQVVLEPDHGRRALLVDSLIMDAATHVAALRRWEASSVRLKQALGSMEGITGADAQALRQRIVSSIDGEVGNPDELVTAVGEVVARSERAKAATARRRAVLTGLASLGYEVRETMASAWERDGRLVVRKPGTADYGVELGAPADAARLQVRLVGAANPVAPRNARRDADQEMIWCSEFDRLRKNLAAEGSELLIERALQPGEQPVRTVAMPLAASPEATAQVPAIQRRSS